MIVRAGSLDDVCGDETSILSYREWEALSRMYAEIDSWDWSSTHWGELRGHSVQSKIVEEIHKRGIDAEKFMVFVFPEELPPGPLSAEWFPTKWRVELRVIRS
tara:strand:- start:407 stop:715 length:309 start_codon:yes stop_codon:yes gene_type:complete